MVQNISRRGVDTLLALHGGLHDGMMRLEGIDIVLVVGKNLLLDALAEAVLADGGDCDGMTVSRDRVSFRRERSERKAQPRADDATY